MRALRETMDLNNASATTNPNVHTCELLCYLIFKILGICFYASTLSPTYSDLTSRSVRIPRDHPSSATMSTGKIIQSKFSEHLNSFLIQDICGKNLRRPNSWKRGDATFLAFGSCCKTLVGGFDINHYCLRTCTLYTDSLLLSGIWKSRFLAG